MVGITVGLAAFTQVGRDIATQVPVFIGPIIEAKQNPDLLFDNVSSDHANILLIGQDRNWKQGKVFDPHTNTYRPMQVEDTDTPARSDTMIVMSLDQTNHAVHMVSFPRDARVTYTDAKGHRHHDQKLNSVYAVGGKELLKQVLSDEFGLRIDRLALIRLDGFKKLIDKVGGINVDVDGALKRDPRTGKLFRGDIDYKDSWGQWEVHLKPGMQWLNGDQAHGYVRFRYDREGDPGRIRRQQQVMRTLAKQLLHAPKLRLPGLVKEMRQQFKTDLPDDEAAAAAFFLQSLGDASKIQPLTLFGIYAENGDIILNRPKNVKLFKTIFGSSFNEDRFLVRSQWTKRDDIGVTNNANAAAQAVLKQAGLLDEEESHESATSPVLTAPQRLDISSNEVNEAGSAPRTDSRRSRVAASEEPATVTEISGVPAPERPRRHRKSRRADREAGGGNTAAPSRSEETPARLESAPARAESPVPAPESAPAPAPAEHSDSPVPQPEQQ